VPETKQGIDLIIDRVEALRVRLNAARTTNQGDAYSDVYSHWISLANEALVELVKLKRDLEQNQLVLEQNQLVFTK
jgi:hypothetical protein